MSLMFSSFSQPLAALGGAKWILLEDFVWERLKGVRTKLWFWCGGEWPRGWVGGWGLVTYAVL